MAEVSFARQFLAALDTRPIRLAADHVTDPRTYPGSPAYILPRHPSAPATPFKARTTHSSTSQPALNLTLHPLRSHAATPPLTLTNSPPDSAIDPTTTSMHDLKTIYATHTGLPASKLKLLYRKKPVTDSKTIQDALGADALAKGEPVEISVMIVGGIPADFKSPLLDSAPSSSQAPVGTSLGTHPSTTAPESAKGPDPSVPEPMEGVESAAVRELHKEVFWDDLKGFLKQRLKDEGEGERLAGVFRRAWESGQARP